MTHLIIPSEGIIPPVIGQRQTRISNESKIKISEIKLKQTKLVQINDKNSVNSSETNFETKNKIKIRNLYKQKRTNHNDFLSMNNIILSKIDSGLNIGIESILAKKPNTNVEVRYFYNFSFRKFGIN
mgnify:CR=1 FL=1